MEVERKSRKTKSAECVDAGSDNNNNEVDEPEKNEENDFLLKKNRKY